MVFMATKLDVLKRAVEEGNRGKVVELSSKLTTDDIIKDLVAKGYIRASPNCYFCNKLLDSRFAGYGVCPACFKDLASKIVSEGGKKKIKEIIEELRLVKKWKV